MDNNFIDVWELCTWNIYTVSIYKLKYGLKATLKPVHNEHLGDNAKLITIVNQRD